MTNMQERSDIPVVILCGGKGVRIRQVSELLPKPLLRIGDHPILWHIMMIYAKQGFRKFILSLGYKGDEIRDYFHNYRSRTSDVTLDFSNGSSLPEITYHDRGLPDPGWTITLAETGPETGTGGRLARVAKYIDNDEFLFTYGDGVGDIDIAASLTRHREMNASVTVTGVHPPTRFGHIEIEDNHILDFAEKPQASEGYISGGFMVMNKDFIPRYLDEGENCILESQALRNVAREGGMAVYRHHGFWMPMDNHMDFENLNNLWANDEAPWKIW